MAGLREVDASLGPVGLEETETQWTPDTGNVGGEGSCSATLRVEGLSKVDGFRERRDGEVLGFGESD